MSHSDERERERDTDSRRSILPIREVRSTPSVSSPSFACALSQSSYKPVLYLLQLFVDPAVFHRCLVPIHLDPSLPFRNLVRLVDRHVLRGLQRSEDLFAAHHTCGMFHDTTRHLFIHTYTNTFMHVCVCVYICMLRKCNPTVCQHK